MASSPAASPPGTSNLPGAVDVLIVGGGITGTALAYQLGQTPGLRVALCDAHELGHGTSGRSSGFLHGGLRYLAHGRIGLVRRALAGRRELARLAPGLVARAPFLLPLGPAAPHPAWALRAALTLYRALGGPEASHRRLAAAEVAACEPLAATLARDGALAYDELSVDGAALVRALGEAAARAGVAIWPRVACDRIHLERGRARGAWLRPAGGPPVHVAAHVVVDASGPRAGWLARGAGRPTRLLRLSRGSHLVFTRARVPLSRTVVFFSPRDRRALFLSPRTDHVLCGTTEVAHAGGTGPRDVRPSRAEVDYLLEALAAAFPRLGLAARDVADAFAGVRPLADARAAGELGDAATLGHLDRAYQIGWDAPGLLALRGGKLTLAPAAARRAVALLAQDRALGLYAPVRALPPLAASLAPQTLAWKAS